MLSRLRGKQARSKNGQQSTSEDPFDLDGYIPQPVEDRVIVSELIQLRKYIESHALKFYHSNPVKLSYTDLVLSLQKDSSIPSLSLFAESLAVALLDPRSRTTGIRAAIARVAFGSMDFFGNSEHTLLSPEAIRMMSQFDAEERPDDLEEGSSPLHHVKECY